MYLYIFFWLFSEHENSALLVLTFLLENKTHLKVFLSACLLLQIQTPLASLLPSITHT